MTETEIQKAGAISFLKMLDAETDPQKRIEIVAFALFKDTTTVSINPRCHFLLNGENDNKGLSARVIGEPKEIIILFCKAFDQAEMVLDLVAESVRVYKQAKKDGLFNKN